MLAVAPFGLVDYVGHRRCPIILDLQSATEFMKSPWVLNHRISPGGAGCLAHKLRRHPRRELKAIVQTGNEGVDG